MNLKTVSKNDLLASTEKLVAEERRITTSILWHFFEIERRRLFAELGFSSLFEYATIQLKYSAGSAQRRISAMRLLKEMPEVGEKIDSGELNVNALSQAQTLFRQARMENKSFTLEAKRELVGKLENKSQRECEKILAEVNPAVVRPSRERVIAALRTEIRFEASDALYAKIQLLKGKFAHRLKGSNDFADLLELLVDDVLKKEKLLPPVETQTKKSTIDDSSSPTAGRSKSVHKHVRSRYVSRSLKQEVFKKAQNQCTFVDPVTRRKCTSTYALEIEHREPFALGGKTELSNLTVLCRSHNAHAAIQKFGLRKMGWHLNSS